MNDRKLESMMLSLKREENVSLCSSLSLSHSLLFLLIERKRKQKLSSSLETNQLDFFLLILIHIYREKKKES
jgi:hypothetical protein